MDVRDPGRFFSLSVFFHLLFALAVVGGANSTVPAPSGPQSSAGSQAARGSQPLPVADKSNPKVDSSRSVLGAAATFSSPAGPTHQLSPGDRLLMGPRLSADFLVRVPQDLQGGFSAVVVEERESGLGLWLRLRWGGVVGWLPPSGAGSRDRWAGREAGDFDGRRARRDQLAEEAKEAMGEGSRGEEWSWRLPTLGGGAEKRTIKVWSNVSSSQALLLRNLTQCLPQLYAQRFGAMQSAQDVPIELVVFALRDTYEQFVEDSMSIDGVETAGFEVDGLVVITADFDSDSDVDLLGTAAHEITHALNRLSFADPPPLWAEEGMAEDLAHSVEAAFLEGAGLCDRPGGWSRTRTEEKIRLVEGKARRYFYVARSARARSLLCYSVPQGVEELLELDNVHFLTAPDRRWVYVGALLLVRNLLGDTDGRAGRLPFPDVDDVRSRIKSTLTRLEWRGADRELMDC